LLEMYCLIAAERARGTDWRKGRQRRLLVVGDQQGCAHKQTKHDDDDGRTKAGKSWSRMGANRAVQGMETNLAMVVRCTLGGLQPYSGVPLSLKLAVVAQPAC
jgi:hypothetical protein